MTAKTKPAQKKPARTDSPVVSPAKASQPFPIVGVGASAGGLEAFKQLLSALSDKPGMAFVLIPHLDPTHTSVMQTLLGAATRLPVLTVENGMRVEQDHVYVIPPNAEMTISKGILELSTRAKGEIAMPIDTFLRSLAEDQPGNAIGIILSGTAHDGSLGVTAIKGEGGITFAQDSESAKYDGMPKSAIATGCVDFVLPPAAIAAELGRIRKHPYITKAPSEGTEVPGEETSYGFARLFKIVKRLSEVDFSGYKEATINRRILRRMALKKIENLADYVRYLERHQDEVEALYHDFLIDVTSFFRNPEAFECLKATVFPLLLKDRAPNDAIRIWVPGCSTGEEAYSHVMCLFEFLSEVRAEFPIQVFGTDVNESAIKKARAGIYNDNITADVSAARLRRFFNKVEGGYQISKSVRDLCIFARQNVLTDAPFSKMDIVSCRNLLIYLGPDLQKRLIPILHYALKPKGCLMLGATEGMVGEGAELFEVVDLKSRIYARKQVPSRVAFTLAVEALTASGDHARPGLVRPQLVPRPVENAVKKADSVLLAKFVPAALVVDDNLDIVHSRGHANRYLQLAPGKASLNLLRMTAPGLMFELQKAVEAVRKSGQPVLREELHVEKDGASQLVNIEVSPIRTDPEVSPMYLITFSEAAVSKEPGKAAKRREAEEGEDTRLREENQRFKAELNSAREHIQSILEQSEGSNEQLQSANEEIQSANEELQSTNEELQTSKEELESGNEELKTVNEELQHRNQQLAHLANDLNNLLNSVNMAIVMLGPDLKVTRFTPQAEKILGLTGVDTGRPLSNIKLKIDTRELEQKALDVMRDIVPAEFSFRDTAGARHLIRMTPYRTSDNKIEGVVLTIPNGSAEK